MKWQQTFIISSGTKYTSQWKYTKTADGIYELSTNKWNQVRVRQIDEEGQLRNEIRRIAREERDKRIRARIEQKREKQELRKAARVKTE